MKKNKLLLGLGTIASISAPLVAIVSCSSSGSSVYATSWNGDRHDLRIPMSSAGGLVPDNKVYQYKSESSLSLGIQKELFTEAKVSYYAFGFRTELVGSPIYDVNGQKIGGKNTQEYLKFALFKAVKITDALGVLHIFDSDSSDASNSKSINSTTFKNLIKSDGNEKVAFTVNTNAKWVQNGTGEVTSYNVTPNDVWTSIMYSVAKSPKNRSEDYKTLGLDSSIIDNKMTSNIDGESWKAATSRDSFNGWTESYGVSLNLDVSPFKNDDKSNFINGNDVEFKFLNAHGYQTQILFNSYAKLKAGMNALLPSKFIEKQKDNIDALIPDGVDKTEFHKSLAYKYGLYSYSNLKNAKDYVSAGAYYLSSFKNTSITYKKNMHFIDQRFVSDNDTVHSLTYNFFDQDTFVAQSYTAYKQGNAISFSSILKLKDSDQKTIDSSGAKYGLKHIKGKTSASILGGESGMTLMPGIDSIKAAKQGNKAYYLFNDEYAKLNYGGTIAQLNDPNSIENTNMYDYHFHGTGLQFRTTLHQIINWYSVIKEISDNAEQYYFSGLAPEMNVQASDGTFEPINYQDPTTGLFNTHSAFIKDGNGLEEVSVSLKEMKEAYKVGGATAIEQLKAVTGTKFNKLKAALNQQITDAGITQNQKVTWELPSTGYSSINMPVLENLRKFIVSLDSRLNPVAQVTPGVVDTTNFVSGLKDFAVKYESFSDPSFTPGLQEKSNDINVAGMSNDPSVDGSYGDWLFRRNDGYFGTVRNAMYTKTTGIPELEGVGSFITNRWWYGQDESSTALSYYDGNRTKIPNTHQSLTKLLDAINNAVTKWKTDFVDSSSIKTTSIKTALKSLTFADIAKSNPLDLIKHSSLGLKPLSALGSAVLDSTDNQVQEDLRTTKSLLNLLMGSYMGLEISKSLEKLTKNELAKVLDAYDEIGCGATAVFKPYDQAIGNREHLAPSLVKSFLKRPSNNLHFAPLSEWKVTE